jgi:zinc transport system ATP-binding protein
MKGMKEGDIILKVKELDVRRGGEVVLENVDFELKKGEVLAVLGPNGSGKSTLLKVLLGILPYENGGFEWADGGLKISYLPDDLSPQKFREIPMSLEEFFRFKKISKEKTEESLRMVGLGDEKLLSRNPGKLSSGQFQRMLVAWSLADDPEILLFDEPTTGVDVGGEETIYSLLERFWKERGLTIILVTHEVNIIYSLADNVLCLRKREFCYGPPEEVLTPERLRELYGSKVRFYEHKA